MTLKQKLAALGISGAAIKNKTDEELQAMLDSAVLEYTSTGQALPWGDDQKGDSDGDEPQPWGRDDGLIEVTVRYSFRGPAKDRCEHNGNAVRPGEELDVKQADELALGELTFAWLVKQSLVTAKG